MNNKTEQFSEEQLERIGNTIIYLLSKINDVPKTKLLKLLYILDEESIKRSGMPFLNLKYKVWHLGPVPERIFSDISSNEISDEVIMLRDYISIKKENKDGTYYNIESEFCSDEFSKSDIKFLNEIIEKFGKLTAKQLVAYTHREGTLWSKIAKNQDLLVKFETKEKTYTDFEIDLTELIKGDKVKEAMHKEYQIFN